MATFLPHPQNKKILIYRKGKIFSKNSNRYIGRLNTDGDMFVSIKIGSQLKQLLVKNLVAQIFVPNPQNLKTVINKNYDRANCRASNLQWTTRSGAKIHSLKKPKRKRSGNTAPRSDDRRTDIAIEMKQKRSKTPPQSNTFIADPDHAEAIFS